MKILQFRNNVLVDVCDFAEDQLKFNSIKMH